jgi:hypothetical protein
MSTEIVPCSALQWINHLNSFKSAVEETLSSVGLDKKCVPGGHSAAWCRAALGWVQGSQAAVALKPGLWGAPGRLQGQQRLAHALLAP